MAKPEPIRNELGQLVGSRSTGEGGSSSSSRKPRAPRRGKIPTGADIRTRIAEAITELAAALEERDPELSRVLKRDGGKMADLLGKWGDHPKAPPPLKLAVVVIAEVLEPVRAFGGTIRLMLRRWRERRLARAAEQELEPELDSAGAVIVDEPAPVTTPPRFAAEYEPEPEP